MFLKQLISFFITASSDPRMGPYHVALYIALFQEWCIQGGKRPVPVVQARLRQVAKIGRTTYHKCMKELEMYGYIKYVPSYSPILGSLVYLVKLEK